MEFWTGVVCGALIFIAGMVLGVFLVLCYLDKPMRGGPLRGVGK